MIAAAESNAGPINEADEAASAAPVASVPERIMRRRPRVSGKSVRERRELDPGTCCPACGGELRLVGEDVSEILDMIAAQMKVIEVARLKKSCRCCEKMVQLPAPSRPIPGSMAGAGLLAYILVSKFDDHLPLYRLNEIFARMGADIPDSTLVDWCGRAMRMLQPLIERIETVIMGSDLLHADDTPIRVLDRSLRDKGLGKGVKKGRTGHMSAINVHGRALPRPVRSIILPLTGKMTTSIITSGRQAASFKPMATKATGSFMSLERTEHPASGRRHAGRIGAATSMISGPRTNPGSRARLSTVSVGSTTSSAMLPASLPISALPPVKSTAKQRSRHSASGPKHN
ncbi:Transposase [Aminobacter sp. MSH1]|nr:Transposase [Aminobacter sp. MSH1]